jgi:hypothetical protein
MKTRFLITALVSLSSTLYGYGQAAPAGEVTSTSFGSSFVPSVTSAFADGIVHYSLSASEIVNHQAYTGSGTYSSTNLSGNVGYQGSSARLPFSLLYAGGVLFNGGDGSGEYTQTYQNVVVSQGFNTALWNFGVTDAISFLPSSPTTGYTGVAGTGDVGSNGGPAQGQAGGILSNSGKLVSNALTGYVDRLLTASTWINGTAGWDILRFTDGTGLDTTMTSGSAGINHRIDARTTVSANAVYSIFTYGTYPGVEQTGLDGISIQTRGINAVFQRQLTHNLSVSVSAGPQLSSSSNSEFIPSTTTVAVSASAGYVYRLSSFYASYNRGINGGSGVQQGTLSNSFSAGGSRAFGRNWQGSLSGTYTRSTALVSNQASASLLGISKEYDTFFGGVQVTRRLGAHTSAYASYTVVHQSGSGFTTSTAPNVYTGTGQIFGIGVTWTPQSTRLGQF